MAYVAYISQKLNPLIISTICMEKRVDKKETTILSLWKIEIEMSEKCDFLVASIRKKINGVRRDFQMMLFLIRNVLVYQSTIAIPSLKIYEKTTYLSYFISSDFSKQKAPTSESPNKLWNMRCENIYKTLFRKPLCKSEYKPSFRHILCELILSSYRVLLI